jgi:hypothetical protein
MKCAKVSKRCDRPALHGLQNESGLPAGACTCLPGNCAASLETDPAPALCCQRIRLDEMPYNNGTREKEGK